MAAKILKYEKVSDHIPFEIQEDIMKRLPVKSLVRFRCVSKPWNSLILSPEFIANYPENNPQQQHILASYVDSVDSEEKYVSIVDDNTFPHNMFFHTVPVSVNQLHSPFFLGGKLIGCSQGLFCFYEYKGKSAVIWNPSVRKSVVISVPNVLDKACQTVVAFAVCPLTKDPKLVKFSFSTDCSRPSMPWQVEVFTLRSRVWRSSYCSNLPRKTMELTGDLEVMDGFIFCLCIDWVIGGNEDNNLIMSFDMISEEFLQINLPDCLSSNFNTNLTMSKLRNSLVLLASDTREDTRKVYDVWMMELGVTKSFTKLFTVDQPHGSIERVIGFRMNGEAIIEIKSDYDDSKISNNFDDYEDFHFLIFAYDPYSRHMDNIGIFGKPLFFSANSYAETLLLLDR